MTVNALVDHDNIFQKLTFYILINNTEGVLGNVYSMQKMIEKCEIHRGEYVGAERHQKQQYVQELKNEMTITMDKIELLQLHCRYDFPILHIYVFLICNI